jgi:hypothetical protein
VADKENDMEHDLRPVTVIRADLVRAKDELAVLDPNLEGTTHSLARHRVMSLSEELRAAEDAAESVAEMVALKWIHRYAVMPRQAPADQRGSLRGYSADA